MNCAHCYGSFGPRDKKELDEVEKLTATRRLKELGIRSIDLLGGEPLIVPEFVDILRETINLSFRDIVIQTNGTIDFSAILSITQNIMNQKKIPSKLSVNVSLEDWNEKNNNHIRRFMPPPKHPGNHYERAIATILQYNQTGIDTWVRTTIFKDNDVENIIKELVIPERLSFIGVRFLPAGRGLSKDPLMQPPGKKRLRELYSFINNLTLTTGRDASLNDVPYYIFNRNYFNQYKNIWEKQGGICQAGTALVSVDSAGDVFPCQVWQGANKFKLGNVFDFESPEQLNKVAKEVFLDKIREIEVRPDCVNCKWFRWCGGGCKWYAHTEGQLGDPVCPIRGEEV